MRCSDMGRDVHFLTLPIQCLPTTPSPTLQGALKDGFGEAVAARDLPEPCEFLSLLTVARRDSCGPSKNLVFDIAPHPVVARTLRVGDADKFSEALGLKNLDPFLSQQAESMSHGLRRGWR